MAEPTNPYPDGSYQHAWWELGRACEQLGRQLAEAFTPALQRVAQAMADLAAALQPWVREAQRRREVRQGYLVGLGLVLFMGLLMVLVARYGP